MGKKSQPNVKMITMSTVISMGWTKTMIASLLPEPKLVDNPYYCKAAPMKLYKEQDVLDAMQSDAYKQALEKANKRKLSAQKATKTKTEILAKNMDAFVESVSVEVISNSELVKETIEAKNAWYCYTGQYEMITNKTKVDSETLHRWVVNYIRHNLVSYDYGLYKMKGKTGKNALYAQYKNAILEKIAAAYPKYAMECRNQMIGHFENSEGEEI